MKKIYLFCGTICCVVTASGSGFGAPASATSNDRPLPRLLSPAQIAKRTAEVAGKDSVSIGTAAQSGRGACTKPSWQGDRIQSYRGGIQCNKKRETFKNLTTSTRNATAITGTNASHGH